jgi:imidazolonepropionase-like amidohydrolase
MSRAQVCRASLALVLALVLPQAGWAQMIAIVGGKVSTAGPVGTLPRATVLLDNGRIVAVGETVSVPADAQVVDATGAWVTPGLFDPWSMLGLSEVEWVLSPQDQSAATGPDAAAFEVAAGVNPDSMLLATARQRGITRAATFPSAARSLFAGFAALIDLGNPDAPVFVEQAAAYMELGARGAQLAGGARGASRALVERVLAEATRQNGSPAAFAGLNVEDMRVVGRIVRGDVPVVVRAQRRSDILEVVALKQRYPRVRMSLLHGNEAWKVAAGLAAAGIPVILDSYDNLPLDFDQLASTQLSAARLSAAGVMVLIAPLSRSSASVPHNSRRLAQYAGNAVAHGLDWEQALKAITLYPARIYGVERNLGSLEAGKIADVVIWNGDPLQLSSRPQAVFIAGKPMSLQTRQSLLRERYRDPAHPDRTGDLRERASQGASAQGSSGQASSN